MGWVGSTLHRHSQGGAGGGIVPQGASKVVLTKIDAPNFYFSAQKRAGEANSGQSWVRSPTPKKSAPSKTNSWLRLCDIVEGGGACVVCSGGIDLLTYLLAERLPRYTIIPRKLAQCALITEGCSQYDCE